MNNVDVSVINVLVDSYPEIFGLYFNEMGSIPNPNLMTRSKASALFQEHCTFEGFDSFMQRYRDWINGPRDQLLARLNAPPPNREQEVRDFQQWVDELEIESLIDPRRKFKMKKFDPSKFLKERNERRDYVYLDFEFKVKLANVYPDEVLELGRLPLVLDVLNKIHDYKLLDGHVSEYL